MNKWMGLWEKFNQYVITLWLIVYRNKGEGQVLWLANSRLELKEYAVTSDTHYPNWSKLYKLRAVFHNTALLKMLLQTWESSGRPHFWSARYKFGASHYPFRFSNSLERLTELRKALYLILQFYYSKRKLFRVSQGKKYIGWDLGFCWKQSFCVLSLWN